MLENSGKYLLLKSRQPGTPGFNQRGDQVHLFSKPFSRRALKDSQLQVDGYIRGNIHWLVETLLVGGDHGGGGEPGLRYVSLGVRLLGD